MFAVIEAPIKYEIKKIFKKVVDQSTNFGL